MASQPSPRDLDGTGDTDPRAAASAAARLEEQSQQRRADNLWVGLGIHLPADSSPTSANAPHIPVGSVGHRHRHRKGHGRHHRPRPHGSAINGGPGYDPQDDAAKDSLGPTQRVQFLLHQDDDNNESESIAPHRLFTEMEELHGEEWRETARWIRFEEDVEEGGNRWSKPHVATLSLHSLFELRSCLNSGSVILDMDATDLSTVIDLLLDKMIANKRLGDEHREDVKNVLLRRHTHQYEHSKGQKAPGDSQTGGFLNTVRSFADMGKSFSTGKNLFSHGQELGHGTPDGEKTPPHFDNQLTLPQVSSVPKNMDGSSDMSHTASEANIKKEPKRVRLMSISYDEPSFRTLLHDVSTMSSGINSTNSLSSHLLNRMDSFSASSAKGNAHFMKKVPPGAEASNVLVGEVEFLDKPISAFIRVQSAIILGDLTEVPVPTRFIFILLGPPGNGAKYREIGRAIATLMSDEVFHDVAYKAHNRNDLLDGVDEFLDSVTVLPPGEWDPNIRIEPPSHIPSQEKRKQQDKDAEGGDKKPDEANEEESGGHAADPALQTTGRLFGGLIADIKRKMPWYISDFKDGLSVQCVASFFFMYFALLAPIVTFGGLLEEATGGYMAAIENILAGSICGCIYSLFSGQPLTIIGSTGPVLVFEGIVHTVSVSMKLYYLSVRLWIGIYCFVILMVLVATDASALVTYITRFTEESFACLISLIFIVEAFKKLFGVLYFHPVTIYTDLPLSFANRSCSCIAGDKLPKVDKIKKAMHQFDRSANLSNTKFLDEYVVNGTTGYDIDYANVPLTLCKKLNGVLLGENCYELYDIFLMSLALMMGTFVLAYTFKLLRTGRFFPSKIRNVVSDFAVMLAIVIMVLVDYFVGLDTPKLNVPSEVRPTRLDRGWLIPFFNGNPWWTVLLAIPPALLACILLFMDQQITAVIVNRKENKLKKGCGYHLDLFVLAILILICSFLGLPYYVAATVLAITHVNSLRVESDVKVPGESTQFLGCREQRVTGFLVFFCIGLSVLFTQFLQLIPMPVLYGVFLYMGVSSLKGVQLVDRLCLFLIPMKYQPDYIYLRHVPLSRVHIFTLVQLGCLALLWIIKAIKTTSIAFPIMLVIMVGIRYLLKFVFSDDELGYLDDKMPEITLRKRDDIKKAKQTKSDDEDSPGDDEEDRTLTTVKTEHNIHIPLASGNVMKIPILPQKPLDISEELKSSDLWKHIESEPSLAVGPNGPPPPYSNGSKKHHRSKHAPRASPEKEMMEMGKRSSRHSPPDPDSDQPIMINVQRPSPVPSPIPTDNEAELPLLPKTKELPDGSSV